MSPALPGEDVDDYVITPSGDEIQGNYRVSYVTDIFEIVASGANVVTVSNLSDATGLTKTYDGAATSVSPTAAVAGSTFEYSLDGVNWTAANPSFTNAGTYSVWVRANAANYETTRAVRATVTINPAACRHRREQRDQDCGCRRPDLHGYGDRPGSRRRSRCRLVRPEQRGRGRRLLPGRDRCHLPGQPELLGDGGSRQLHRPGRYGSGDPGCCDARDAGPGCACCPGGSRSRRSGSGRHSCGCDAGSGRRAHRGRCHAAGRRAR